MNRFIVGVMGPGNDATEENIKDAKELGWLIAEQGWVLLSGGRDSGVMDAVNKGAKGAGGLTVGILPTTDTDAISTAVDIPIITDMGSARNNINVLSSHVIVACGMGCGTASEVALALKANKPVVLLNTGQDSEKFFGDLRPENVFIAKSPSEAIQIIKEIAFAA